jgi:hypothetical protein
MVFEDAQVFAALACPLALMSVIAPRTPRYG